jgi:putative tryptophan/tyrosine transport system substrate-binding protein
VVFNPAIWSIEHLHAPAAALRLTVIPVPIRAVDELAGPPDPEARNIDALALLTDPAVLESNLQTTIGFVSRAGVPAVFPWRSYVVAGGLMSYAASLDDLYRRAAVTVARILNGEHPSQLPIEQPDRFELAINVRTARALGLSFPASVLLRADEVIE